MIPTRQIFNHVSSCLVFLFPSIALPFFLNHLRMLSSLFPNVQYILAEGEVLPCIKALRCIYTFSWCSFIKEFLFLLYKGFLRLVSSIFHLHSFAFFYTLLSYGSRAITACLSSFLFLFSAFFPALQVTLNCFVLSFS